MDSEPDSPPDTLVGPDDTGETGTTAEDELLYEQFFDVSVIQVVDIRLSAEAINLLHQDGRTYVKGAATINGVAFDEVGVRLKGSSTYQDLDCADGLCKAAFKLRLNKYVQGQLYGGLERITLNNMVTDYTQSKEVIAYEVLRQQSQLASRSNFARVTVNGELMGLYTNLESADDRWLKRRFEDASGDFWGTAFSYGDFYTPYLDTGWVPKSGSGDLGKLEAITAALDGFSGDFFGELGGLVNTEQWLSYWGWCAALGNYDGYPFNLNDVLIYFDPSDGERVVFAPWGTDESWAEYELTGQSWEVVGGRLGLACLYDPACVDALRDHIRAATEGYDATEVLTLAEAAWALTEADVQVDPRRPYTPADVWAYRDYYAALIPRYGSYVRDRLD